LSRRFFKRPSAVAATFVMAGAELALLILILFLCHRQYRVNEQQARAQNMRILRPHSRENPFAADTFAYSDTRYFAGTVSRRSSWKKRPSLRAMDEKAMDHTENRFSTQGLNGQQNNTGNDTPYKIRNPHLAGINSGAAVDCQDGNLEGLLTRHPYGPNPRQSSYGDGTMKRSHSLVVVPSRIYLPTHWRRISGVPSPPPICLDTLSAAEDDKADHRLPTPASIARPKPAICSNQSDNWGPSPSKPCSSRISVDPKPCMMTTPPGSEDDCGCLAAARQKPPFDGPSQSLPPPRPPRNPLRKTPSMRTMPDVSFLTCLPDLFSPSFEHSLTSSVAFADPREQGGTEAMILVLYR
jgi:hypothetical protein